MRPIIPHPHRSTKRISQTSRHRFLCVPGHDQANCAQNNYGQQVVIGFVPPPYRVIPPEKMTASVATLRSASDGSKVKINCAAVDGDKEIERFSKQVTALFAAANHWHVETARIGKSMNFADGGTLTGEGIGHSIGHWTARSQGSID